MERPAACACGSGGAGRAEGGGGGTAVLRNWLAVEEAALGLLLLGGGAGGTRWGDDCEIGGRCESVIFQLRFS
ncbi:MAG: hypothetical protein Fur006_21720 [Coleofasciculaceae cyanobacterium]